MREAYDRGEFTLSELAEKSGKTLATVSRVFAGKIDPPYSTVMNYWSIYQQIAEQKESCKTQSQ